MSSFLLLLSAVSFVVPSVIATTPFERHNLVYRSPYANDESLAVDTHSVYKRHMDSGDKLYKRQQLLKREQKTTRPGGKPDNYIESGYGGAVTKWDDATYIYAGDLNFTHSVASGDPYDYSVILWTRAIPVGGAQVDIPACVTYNVYDGPDATGNLVSSGYALSSYDVDFTYKVEATGLAASTVYSYQFANCAKPEQKSAVGRTRTAPGKHATDVEKQSFAVYSCSNYPNGFFNAYGGPVFNDDVQYVVHLGDYLYEYGTGGKDIGREPSGGKEVVTLHDYRQRYAQYHSDPDLSENHRLFPWINIWDDHEVADNTWKAGSTNTNDSYPAGCTFGGQTGVCFTERAANAKRAYHEWIPIRQVDINDEQRIWRDFKFGDLLDVIALDTRQYDRDMTDIYVNTDYIADLAIDLNSTRSITGPVQQEWFRKTLDDSSKRGTKWRLVLNQVIFGTINHLSTSLDPNDPTPFSVNYDAWDGYQKERLDILNYAYDSQLNNTVIVTGDTHANWVFENNLDNVLKGSKDTDSLKPVQAKTATYQRGQIVEFGGTAVSSNGWGNGFLNERNATEKGAAGLVRDSAGLLWSEGFYRGYMNVEVSYDGITTTYWAYADNKVKRHQNRTMSAQFVQLPDKNQLERPLSSVYGAIKPGN